MNPRVTLGFLVAVIVVGALVFGLDRFNIGPTAASQAAATATSSASQQKPIFEFDDSKTSAFEIRQGDKSVRVEKNGDAWTVAGTGEPANRASFTSLMARFSQLKATRGVDNPSTDLTQYGLDPPRESAAAELNDGSRFELQIGSKTPVQSGTYAKRGDAADIYVIPDQIVNDIERLLNDPKEPPTPTPRPPTPLPGASPSAQETPSPDETPEP